MYVFLFSCCSRTVHSRKLELLTAAIIFDKIEYETIYLQQFVFILFLVKVEMSSSDESVMDTSEMDQELSTSHESTTAHMPPADVDIFGEPCEFSGLTLPTENDILKYYFFLAESLKNQNKKVDYKSLTHIVLEKLLEIWNKLGIELMEHKNMPRKLDGLIKRYKTKTRSKRTSIAFAESTKQLFYIGKC